MRALLMFCFLGFSLYSYGQGPFRDLSFEEALQKARKEGKLLFVQYDSEDCLPCNEVADKGLSDPKFEKDLQASFIAIRIRPEHPERKWIAETYHMEQGMGSLFIDIDKTLLHAYRMTSSRQGDYSAQLDIARSYAGENLRLTELERSYRSGNRSTGLLELLLEKRRRLNLPTHDLLEEYVGSLPADSLRSEYTLRYLALEAPALGSRADSVLRADPRLFARVWYAMSLQQRVALNNRIITKSRQKAIKDRNEAYAIRVASFARSTYNNNITAGNKSFEAHLLEYYKQVGDTVKYLASAVPYYNRYLMTVGVDSVKRVDSLRLKEALGKATPEPARRGDSGMVMRRSASFAPIAQHYTRELVSGASTLYRMSRNPAMLATATAWAKRGLEFFESTEALETYALLLYSQGKTAEAVEVQQKLIRLNRQRGYGTKRHEEMLLRMRSGQASF